MGNGLNNQEYSRLNVKRDIESGIQKVIIDLNNNHQKTTMSCHGHKDQAALSKRNDIYRYGRGWIAFDKNHSNHTKIMEILKRNGLKRIDHYNHPLHTTDPKYKNIVIYSFTMIR